MYVFNVFNTVTSISLGHYKTRVIDTFLYFAEIERLPIFVEKSDSLAT